MLASSSSSSPRADALPQPRAVSAVVRRSVSALAMEDERDGLLGEEAPAGTAATACGAPPPPAAISWKVYRTIALLSLTTLFLFADQNLMARGAARPASIPSALTSRVSGALLRRLRRRPT